MLSAAGTLQRGSSRLEGTVDSEGGVLRACAVRVAANSETCTPVGMIQGSELEKYKIWPFLNSVDAASSSLVAGELLFALFT